MDREVDIRRPLKGVKRRVRLSLPLCGLPRWGPLPGKPPPPPRHFCPGWFCSASSATCHPDMVRSFCKPVRSFCKPVRTSPEHLKSIIFIGGLFKIGLSCYTPRIYFFHVFQPFVLLFGWILMLIFSQKPSPDRFKPALTRPRSFKNRPRSILGFPRTVQEVPRPPKMLPRRLLATPKWCQNVPRMPKMLPRRLLATPKWCQNLHLVIFLHASWRATKKWWSAHGTICRHSW